MKIKRFYVYALVFSTMFSSFSVAQSENLCEGKVSYKWKQGDSEREEFFASFVGKGVSEAEAKATLKTLVEKAKREASTSCKDAHENLSGCMANRYTKLGSSYNTMAFGIRKQMDDAVKTDCEKSQGQCLGVSAAEEPCRVVEAAASGEVASGSDKDKNSDKKDKKDPKK